MYSVFFMFFLFLTGEAGLTAQRSYSVTVLQRSGQAQPILFGATKVALFFELTKFSHAKNTIICCKTYFQPLSSHI